MRLNPFNTGNIKVGSTGGAGKAGGIGCGTLVLAALGYFIFGADPLQTIGMVEGVQQQSAGPAPANEDEQALCTSNQYATETCNALESLNDTWPVLFEEQGIGGFRQPTLRFATSSRFNTGCGAASTGMGPFYCPADETIYIDTGFYDQLGRMAGNGGDFARLYVVAHEYAHHIQYITGLSGQIRSAQQQNPRRANQLNVIMELHADCYAGVWAGRNRNLIERGDFEEGMAAAAAIGDDTITGGRVSQESFTHGTSQQRMEALRLGMETGDDLQCDARYFG
ncbi:neutral zinc metallopeptidase [Aurantiacibacter gangjinensis]|uniref:Zinc metalloprotease n=1 Tax=Aurantiacibacter gangjinensis TaxID=502682 RepID=A0A0G9MPV7_9SPHN|nr:neutral zinc metallopeptidase [Aurantiacibacter gangjinensis]APE28543.1 YpfJ protein, zinc metalloprotease superfamily [Aurantiacibacter gangjinensis]KLE32740.1 zinc metalloprotease [Aurantiacibacter gangjinensis]